MAVAAYDDGGYVNLVGSNTLVTSSITAGNTVIIFMQGRLLNTPPFTHGSGLSSVTLIEGEDSTGYADDGTCFVYSAVKSGTGALTITPSQSSDNWWRAIVFDCGTDTVVDSNVGHEGLFDDTISFASPAMPSGGGTGLGMVLGCRGTDVTLSAPTFTGVSVTDAYDSGAFRESIAYGSLAIAGSATSTLTGSAASTTSHYEAWVLLQAAASGATASPATVALAIGQPAVTARAGATATPATAAFSLSVPAVTASEIAGATASPAVVALAIAQPAVTPLAGATASPAAVALAVAQPAVTPLAGATASPAAVALVIAQPPVTASEIAGGTATPATVALAIAQPAVTPLAGSTATPATVALVIGVPAVRAVDGSGIAVRLIHWVMHRRRSKGGSSRPLRSSGNA